MEPSMEPSNHSSTESSRMKLGKNIALVIEHTIWYAYESELWSTVNKEILHKVYNKVRLEVRVPVVAEITFQVLNQVI